MAQQTGVQDFCGEAKERLSSEWNETERKDDDVVIKIFILKRLSECFRVCCLLPVRLPDENEVDNANEFLITTGKTDETGNEKNNNKMKRQQKVRT